MMTSREREEYLDHIRLREGWGESHFLRQFNSYDQLCWYFATIAMPAETWTSYIEQCRDGLVHDELERIEAINDPFDRWAEYVGTVNLLEHPRHHDWSKPYFILTVGRLPTVIEFWAGGVEHVDPIITNLVRELDEIIARLCSTGLKPAWGMVGPVFGRTSESSVTDPAWNKNNEGKHNQVGKDSTVAEEDVRSEENCETAEHFKREWTTSLEAVAARAVLDSAAIAVGLSSVDVEALSQEFNDRYERAVWEVKRKKLRRLLAG